MKYFAAFSLLFITIIAIGSAQKKLPPGGIRWINCTRPHEFYDCGSACQTECKTLGKPCPIINIRCNDACYCVKGYARDDHGRCIPIKDCRKR